MALQDAIHAVYSKVQTDLTSATPEELAYLTTSLEKIGGRATVYDVIEVGETKKTEIEEVATQALIDINADTAEAISTFETSINSIVTTSENAFTVLTDSTTVNLESIAQTAEDSVAAATASLESTIDQVESDIADAGAALQDAAAIANQQAINGSFFNLYFYGTLH